MKAAIFSNLSPRVGFGVDRKMAVSRSQVMVVAASRNHLYRRRLQVVIDAGPRNHLYLLGQQVKIRSSPRNHRYKHSRGNPSGSVCFWRFPNGLPLRPREDLTQFAASGCSAPRKLEGSRGSGHQKPRETPNVTDIVALDRRREMAHVHVIDQTLAKRADGSLGKYPGHHSVPFVERNRMDLNRPGFAGDPNS